MIVSPEVIVEAAGPLGDAPSRPIKAFYNLCGYDPSEESPILLSWIGDFFLSGGLPDYSAAIRPALMAGQSR